MKSNTVAVKRARRKPIKLEDLTPALLAKDALELIRVGKFMPKLQSYMTFENELLEKWGGKSLQKAIKTPKFRCEGCEIGAMLIAYVDQANQLNLPETNDWMGSQGLITAIDKLKAIIPEPQLRLMEAAFEGKDISDKLPSIYANAAMRFAVKFGNQRHPDALDADKHNTNVAKKRMVAIMKNIIANGQFSLPMPVLEEWE